MIRALFLIAITLALPARAATDIQVVTSPGGITAWLVEEQSIPMIALEVSFRGGTSLDPAGKEGATYLMSGLIEEGAGDMDAAAFLKETEALAARFRYRAYRDTMTISAEVLQENAGEALDLLRTALVDPSFSDVAVERVRTQVLSSLQSDLTDPDEIAGEALRRLSFPGHPYGTLDEGSIESVTGLTRDDIVAAHKAALVKSRMFVGVVGAVTAEELGPMLDRLLGDLPQDGPPLPERTQMALKGGTTVIELNAPQSVALFAQPGIDRDDPDYFAAYLLNEILGGSGFESRLMREVREKRGLTYGVYSFLAPFDYASQIIGNVASANDRIAEAIEVVRAEWQRIADEGVTEDELNAAKLFVTGAYPLRFDGNSNIASILVGLQVADLGKDYPLTRNAKMDAVTIDDVNAMAKRLIRPEDLHVIVVGQPEGLTDAALK